MSHDKSITSGMVSSSITPMHETILALLRAGKNDEAIVQLCAIVMTQPGDLNAEELLFEAFFQKRDYPPALAIIEKLVRLQPQTQRLRKAMIVTLSNMKRYADAIAHASRYIAEYGEDLSMLDVLKVAFFYTDKIDEAIRCGQRVIELRDANACRNPPRMVVTKPAGRRGLKVISFSLWGAAPFYAYGAMINLVLSRTIYPGWTCRFYVDAKVPRSCIAFLAENGADVRNIEDEYPGVGLFQRFLIMNDPTVERFLVRDCDARLCPAEAELVEEWMASGCPFHVVRDHVLHSELMIGCLWGGRTDW
jgi:tetratricopeptide (TPR) repeat protein